MNISQYISKQLSYSDKEKISRYLRQILEYNIIQFDEKIFFSSTSTFSLKLSNDEIVSQKFPLKILIPDYILENFSFHSREQKNIIIDFIKIFIKEILYLEYYVEINKKNLIYSYSFNDSSVELKFFSRRDVLTFFRKYFVSTPEFKEGCPKRIKNNKQFNLGTDRISVKVLNRSATLGRYFYTFLNKFVVSIEILDSEINNLINVINHLKMDKYLFLFSNNNRKLRRAMKFYFLFENNKCVHIYSIPLG